jgi:hypothetical protein
LGEEDVSTSGGRTGNQSRHGEETYQQGFADAERRNEILTVIQSEAKNLGNINVDEHEILPPFGRLNDNY